MTQTKIETHTSLDDLPLLDPSSPNVGTALRRHPLTVLACVLVCLLAAAAVGLARKPNYTANAKLQVGNIDLKLPGAIGGLQAANEELATSYSRQIQAPPVINAVARQLHLSRPAVLAALSSTPVPLSGDFTVTADTKSQTQSVAIANAAGNALIKDVASQNNNQAYVQHLWAQYQAAAGQVASAQIQNLLAHQAISQSKGHPTSAQLKALAKAQATLDTASMQKQGLQQAYLTARAQETNTPQLVAPALVAASDRATKLVIFMFGGLVAGLLIGTALATLRARRQVAHLLG